MVWDPLKVLGYFYVRKISVTQPGISGHAECCIGSADRANLKIRKKGITVLFRYDQLSDLSYFSFTAWNWKSASMQTPVRIA